MKKTLIYASIILIGGFFYSCSNATANNVTSSDVKEEVKEKKEVKKPEVKNEYKPSIPGWNVGLDKVYEMSQKTGKPILANFTGSDWCGWCHRLKASVFDKPDFKAWANENVILYEVDFPRGKKLPTNIAQENASLQQSLGVRGYPTVFLFGLKKVDGKYNIEAKGRLGYEQSSATFIAKCNQFLGQKEKE